MDAEHDEGSPASGSAAPPQRPTSAKKRAPARRARARAATPREAYDALLPPPDGGQSPLSAYRAARLARILAFNDSRVLALPPSALAEYRRMYTMGVQACEGVLLNDLAMQLHNAFSAIPERRHRREFIALVQNAGLDDLLPSTIPVPQLSAED